MSLKIYISEILIVQMVYYVGSFWVFIILLYNDCVI